MKMNEIQMEIVLCLMHCVDNLHSVFILEMKEKMLTIVKLTGFTNFLNSSIQLGKMISLTS